LIIGGVVLLVVAVLVAWSIASCIIIWGRADDSSVTGAAGAGLRRFKYRDLASATGEFSEEKKLGEGAFGAVYQGSFFRNDQDGQRLEELLAVKKIKACDTRATRAFLAELVTISRTGHRNLVRLEGWCCGSSRWNLIDFMCWCRQRQRQDLELFLVYELVPNGSLHEHLHEREEVLPWTTRYLPTYTHVCLQVVKCILFEFPICKVTEKLLLLPMRKNYR
jgi:serine/threonine protein kinase